MRKIVAILLLFVSTAVAVDLSGKWSGTFRATGADHDVPQLFILKQDGSKLTGSGGPDASEQYPIENPRIDDDKVTFEITTGEWKFRYQLKISGAHLTGDLELTSAGSRRTAKVALNRADSVSVRQSSISAATPVGVVSRKSSAKTPTSPGVWP